MWLRGISWGEGGGAGGEALFRLFMCPKPVSMPCVPQLCPGRGPCGLSSYPPAHRMAQSPYSEHHLLPTRVPVLLNDLPKREPEGPHLPLCPHFEIFPDLLTFPVLQPPPGPPKATLLSPPPAAIPAGPLDGSVYLCRVCLPRCQLQEATLVPTDNPLSALAFQKESEILSSQ